MNIELTPAQKLKNLVDALKEDADGSPFTQEEWDRIDKENLRLAFQNNELHKKLKYILGFASEIYAVELLQYHNKNWLQDGTEPARLSESIQEKLEIIINTIKKIK